MPSLRLALLLVLASCSVALRIGPPARRRDVLPSFPAALAALALLPAAPPAAHAQRSKLIPKSSAESTAAAKAYKLSKPGEESAEFKALEKRRADAAAGIKPQGGFESSDEKLLRKTLAKSGGISLDIAGRGPAK